MFLHLEPRDSTARLLIAAVLCTACAACRTNGTVGVPAVAVNQVGYLPLAPKVAVVASEAPALNWSLLDEAGDVVSSGQTSARGYDPASGDHLHRIDFSAVAQMGSYRIKIEELGAPEPVVIADGIYDRLPEDAMAYFYFHRMGVPVDAVHMRHPEHGRAALHPDAHRVAAFGGWTPHRFNVARAWADAGDFGLYSVNHAFASWVLLNLHERYDAFTDGSLAIPEAGNGRSDLLDEVEFGSTFLKGMLPPTGLASHKVHADRWSTFPISVEEENRMSRWAMPPSTNATWAIARTYAHLARRLRSVSPEAAAAYIAIAEDAYRRAEADPDVDYVTETKGGGAYPDEQNDDDAYAAAVELFLTTKAPRYRKALMASPHYGVVDAFYWRDVATLGTLSLLTVDNDLPTADLAAMRAALQARADVLTERIHTGGYPTSLLPDGYVWGSNGVVLSDMMVIAYAYDETRQRRHLEALFLAMDYLMGNNAIGHSFITGYGRRREHDLHDRLAYGAYLKGTPFPPGWIAGGPNNVLINDKATPQGAPAAKSYAGPSTAPKAWCSKENTINWNAPLAWVAWYLRAHRGSLEAKGPE